MAFIDVNNDGLEDLHLFSFSPKQGSTSGEVELTALVFFRQETPGRSSNDLSFSSFPNRRYGILASNFPNGVSTLRDLNGDGIPDIEFTSIDLTASITNLLLRRSIAVSYKPILYNRYTHRYEDTGLELGNTLSIDQPRASQTQAGSALESLAGLDFTQMIGRIFPRFDAPSGVSARPQPQASASSPLLFMYNGQGRQLSYFRLPNLRNGQGLQTPSFLRVTDQPELIMTGDVLEVYLIRSGRMYYQRIPL
ncbi:hypothetical protein [Spirochaeta lutea]|uniref:Uncharacterized protein n=1 Tax=Spirochaeta lutea TaxID=1480694 RepID=A0A098QWG1_9SPIO|nr:hypothetical protein [Spirochaeta lutea]KGE72215.1 hypothetical protein DC28_07470 [Spirochaeta lutea]